jgi:hypothetical protein
MVRNSGKRDKSGKGKDNETSKVDEDVDALFTLPLSEFMSARKTLAAQLKQLGRGSDADRVKALAKPSISAWTVNQLYWNHREAFDQLIATGQRFRQVQTSRLAGKVAEMREALDARREALSHLEGLATELLHDAGHNPTLDTLRRVTTTLEALSVYASLPDAPPSGRLTHDVDPPGFESLTSSIAGTGMMARTPQPARVTVSKKNAIAETSTRRSAPQQADAQQLKETRQTKIAAAKASVQDAKRVLIESRASLQSAQATQKKVNADVKEAEKQKHEAEQRLDTARVALQDATRLARSAAAKVAETVKAVQDAERSVEKASEELEKAFRESP